MTRDAPSSDRPTVSVVIPVKDDAAHLYRCLQALAAQTRPADEVVVVDNDSSDDSADVARDAGARVVRCETPGIPAAAARGYDAATKDLILRCDADCVPTGVWIEAIVTRFETSPHVDALSGGARFIDGPRLLRMPLAAAYLGAYLAVAFATLGHPGLFGSNLAMRRAAWRSVRTQVHRVDPGIHDDLDLSFHLGERFRIRPISHVAMGMSMRPFTDPRGFARRIGRGFRTVVLHWPHDFPPMRWDRLLLRRLLGRHQMQPRGGARS